MGRGGGRRAGNGRHQMNAKSRFVLGSVAAVMAAFTARSADLTVGTGGAYTSISAAVAAAANGDTVWVNPGVYSETVTVRRSVALMGATGSMPRLQGRIIIATNDVFVGGLEIADWTSDGVISYGIQAYQRSGITISNCWIHADLRYGSSCGIYIRLGSRIAILNNRIHNACKGINLQSVFSDDNTYARGSLVANNRIHDNFNDGVDVHGRFITIRGNVIGNNLDTNAITAHADGIQFVASTVDGQTAVQNCRIIGNTIYNHVQGIFIESRSEQKCRDIEVINNVVFSTPGLVNGLDMDTVANTLLVIFGGENVAVYNNHFERAGTLVSLRAPSTPGATVIRNNTLKQTRAKPCLWVEMTNLLAAGSMSHNIFHRPDTNHVIQFASRLFSRVEEFREQTGLDEGSVTLDPLTGPPPEPRMLAGAPGIGAGTNLTALFVSDITGATRPDRGAWDIGPYTVSTAPVSPPAPPGRVRKK